MGRFDGKVALVTGASRGIGLAVAHRLVEDGAKVVITARKPDALAEAVSGLGEDNAAFVAGSADDEAHQDEAIAAAIDRFGGLDYLVNNTGINPVYGPLKDMDEGAAAKIMRVNVIGSLAWASKAHTAGIAASGGAIVNIGSIAGIRPAPGIGMYGTSKAAVIHLTEELAVEFGPGVRVNAVAPAIVKTRFATALYEGREDEVTEPYPLKRLGEPADIAGPVTFLLSDDAAWMTGQTVVIDGGISLSGGV